MNEIYGMTLQYESLIPIDRLKNTFLSVETVTFLVDGDELPLDFNITEGSVKGNAGSIICVNAEIKDFDPEVFMDEYKELGLSSSDLNYDFFAKTTMKLIWRRYIQNLFIQLQKKFIFRSP